MFACTELACRADGAAASFCCFTSIPVPTLPTDPVHLPYSPQQDQFGNTTVTVPSAFVPGEGYTQEDVNNYLRSTGVNDLCDITLPSNNKGVCEDTEFFSIPFYLPPQVRNDVKARAAAIPRRAAIAARRAATTPARRGWYN